MVDPWLGRRRRCHRGRGVHPTRPASCPLIRRPRVFLTEGDASAYTFRVCRARGLRKKCGLSVVCVLGGAHMNPAEAEQFAQELVAAYGLSNWRVELDSAVRR